MGKGRTPLLPVGARQWGNSWTQEPDLRVAESGGEWMDPKSLGILGKKTRTEPLIVPFETPPYLPVEW